MKKYEIIKFVNENPISYLATVDGTIPRVRAKYTEQTKTASYSTLLQRSIKTITEKSPHRNVLCRL